MFVWSDDITLIMEAVRNFETSVNSNETERCYTPEALIFILATVKI
jgi:hypothetical protein